MSGGDHFWLPKMVWGGTTFGVGPLLARGDHLWLPKVVWGDQFWLPKVVWGDQFWLPKVVRGTTFGRDHFWHDRPHSDELLATLQRMVDKVTACHSTWQHSLSRGRELEVDKGSIPSPEGGSLRWTTCHSTWQHC